jgi:hypothetical protein
LIHEAAGGDTRVEAIMEGIRAGESLHNSRYDVKNDELESSWGPFQLNRRRGLGVDFERETGLDLRDPKTIPDQARWVAKYIREHHGTNGQWMGYHGPRRADPNWGDSGYIPAKRTATAPSPSTPARGPHAFLHRPHKTRITINNNPGGNVNTTAAIAAAH